MTKTSPAMHVAPIAVANEMPMQGPYNRAVRDGRQVLQVPAVLMVVGRYGGSQGPLVYIADDLQKSVPKWDGIKVCIQHPTSGGSGVSIETMTDHQAGVVGRVTKPKFDGLRLSAVLELDEHLLAQHGPQVLADLQAAKPVELSTGLFCNKAHGHGPYTAAVDHRPDHLALLPGKVGACSVRQGCGTIPPKKRGPVVPLYNQLGPPMHETSDGRKIPMFVPGGEPGTQPRQPTQPQQKQQPMRTPDPVFGSDSSHPAAPTNNQTPCGCNKGKAGQQPMRTPDPVFGT